ncbi:PP2C family protein-serine/threonine phosphatase [Neptunomonas sp.]|uniref:PP2C family protein-serine/threonine phosphatase n=1 Tax=Neptunomonas sp. TaxID=1971898 RepID=UPI0035674F2E
MTNYLSGIQLFGFRQQDLSLIRSVLSSAGLDGPGIEALDNVMPEAGLLFKNFGIYVLSVSDRIDFEHLKPLAGDDGRFPIIVILHQNSTPSVIDALRAGADDVFYIESLQVESPDFINSIQLKLNRCRLLYERLVYREGLEASLEELKDDQYAAFQVQSRLLPAAQQVIHDIEYQFSITPSLIVSGDFVDVVPISDELTLFYLADVSGHGASSALVTVLLKNITSRLLRNFKRSSSYDILSPLETLTRFNTEIYALGLDKHLTIFCGLINQPENTLTYAVGGHHPMPVYKSPEKLMVLEGRGMPVGLFTDAVFVEKKIVLDKNFSLYLFSDGVLELLPQSSIVEKEKALLDWLDATNVNFSALKSHIFEGNKHLEQYPDDIAIMSVSRVIL